MIDHVISRDSYETNSQYLFFCCDLRKGVRCQRSYEGVMYLIPVIGIVLPIPLHERYAHKDETKVKETTGFDYRANKTFDASVLQTAQNSQTHFTQ